MSLETQLGLETPDGDLWVLARDRWHGWKQTCPALDVCEDLTDLRGWVKQSDPAEVNVVLLALAELGAADGQDDPAATGALLWLLLPGAIKMTHTLAPLSHRIDQLVAAQLWICARTVSWRKGVQVAGTVLMNTRRDVMGDLGLSTSARAREVPVGDIELVEPHRVGPPTRPGVVGEAASSSGACDLLHDLLAHAARDGLVSLEDCRILLDLAEVTDTPRAGRGHAGLLGRRATSTVATKRGMSRATLARRSRCALAALHDTYAPQVRSA